MIEGEVDWPGSYSISRKDERISDIIARAQNLTQYACPRGAYSYYLERLSFLPQSRVIKYLKNIYKN